MIELLVGLVSANLFLGLQVAIFLLYLQMAFPLYTCISGVSSSSDKDTSHNGLVPYLRTSFNPNYLFKGLILRLPWWFSG